MRRPWWERIRFELGAGLLTWGVVALPVLVEGVLRGGLEASARSFGWFVAWAVFGAIFALVASGRIDHLSYATHRVLLAVATIAALSALALLPSYGTTAILLIITAIVATHVLPDPLALAWIGGQATMVAVVALGRHVDPVGAWIEAAGYLCFMGFAYLTTRGSLRETRAKDALARKNAELLATQHLLAESQRAAERVRIARDVHDLVGHHLTALVLNLDVASRLSDGEAEEATERAHGIAKLLLGDVREAVHALREHDEIDLAAALAPLVEQVPRPAVHLSVADDLHVSDPRKANALLRCVQEVITNAAKHADARNLWIEVREDAEGVTVRARDDGRGVRRDGVGAGAVGPGGLGLPGMRARLESVGGRFEASSRPGAGFAVTAFVPRDGS